MTTLDQAHAIVARQGWLSYAPAPFRQKCWLAASCRDFPQGNDLLCRRPARRDVRPCRRPARDFGRARRARSYIGHFAQPGTWFGEAAAFTEQARRIGLVGNARNRVLHLPLHAIREIVAADPELGDGSASPR